MKKSALVRSQDKEVSAKGASVGSCVTHPRKQQIPKDIGPAVHLTLRAPQPRERTSLQEPLSRNPLLLVLEL